MEPLIGCSAHVLGPIACGLVMGIGMIPGFWLARWISKGLRLPEYAANGLGQLLSWITGIGLLAAVGMGVMRVLDQRGRSPD